VSILFENESAMYKKQWINNVDKYYGNNHKNFTCMG
jgi:hypothetical protein